MSAENAPKAIQPMEKIVPMPKLDIALPPESSVGEELDPLELEVEVEVGFGVATVPV